MKYKAVLFDLDGTGRVLPLTREEILLDFILVLCLPPTKNQAPKNTRFTKLIFNVINLIVPVALGKQSCIFRH